MAENGSILYRHHSAPLPAASKHARSFNITSDIREADQTRHPFPPLLDATVSDPEWCFSQHESHGQPTLIAYGSPARELIQAADEVTSAPNLCWASWTRHAPAGPQH